MPRKTRSTVTKNTEQPGDFRAPDENTPGGQAESAGKDNEAPTQFEKRSGVEILVRQLTKNGTKPKPVGDAWKEVFLETLAKAPIAAVAAQVAGVSRRQAVALREADPEFARRWDEAVEEGVDEIEAAAFQGAVFGDDRPVYYGGEFVGTTVEHSQAMRTLLLKNRRPAVYGEKAEAPEEVTVGLTLEEFKKRVEEARREV